MAEAAVPEDHAPWVAGRMGLLAAGGLGAAAGLGQAPYGLWPVTLVALAGLFALFSMQSGPWRAARLGWVAGTGHFLLAFSWIVEPFLVDAARHGWMAPFALLFLSGGMALYWAAGFAIARLLGAGAPAWVAALTLTEAARGIFFTGFPWAQVGHVWIDTPMLAWSSIAGPLGLSALALTAGSALWLSLRRHVPGILMLLVVAGLFAAGPLLRPPADAGADAARVRLVQPNAPQHEKWDADKLGTFFERQIAFTAEAPRPDLIVWPETSVPVLLDRADAALARISEAAGGAPVVVGIQRRDGRRLFNSMVLVGEGGARLSRYDKHHLVPFGEYLPFGAYLKKYGLRGLAAEDGNGYSAGTGARIIDIEPLGTALPLICYEGVFARDVAAAPGRPDFLLLITNDAWFGTMSGPHQHLAQARLRSAEQGLPMIRVANTGISAMIDAAGRVTGRIALGEAGWIDLPLPPPAPPTIYARAGDWPVLALAVLTLGLGGLSRGATRRK